MATEQHDDLDFLDEVRILRLPAPTDPQEPVRLAELNAAVEGLAWKDEARVSTQGNINLAAPGATIDGVALANGDRVLVRAQTAAAENGLYLWNGASNPMTRAADASTAEELRQATIAVYEGTDAGKVYRQTATIGVLNTDPVNWITFGTAAPPASETTPGIIEIATQTEVDAGLSGILALTPLTLANAASRKRKTTAVIGDGSAKQFDITHGFATLDCFVEVRRNSAPYDTIGVTVQRVDGNTVRIRFKTTPAVNQFVVQVLA